MNKREFLKHTGITEDQFSGKKQIYGDLWLSGLQSIPDNFNPTVGGDLYTKKMLIRIGEKQTYFLTWKKEGKTFIKCDGRFSEVILKKGNVWKLKDLNKNNEYYLVTDKKGKFAHGHTISEAKSDLIYKISNRDKSEYIGISVNKKMSFEKCIEMYRVITGACSSGVRNFIESKGIKKNQFTIKEIVEITSGAYGGDSFKSFFKI